MPSEKFRTNNQVEMLNAFSYACQNSDVVAILDYPGSGFKYALNYFAQQNRKVKISCACIQFNCGKDISVEVMRNPDHLRFSNLSYSKMNLVDFLYKLNERSKEILIEKQILIALDNFERLNTVTKLSRAIQIVKSIRFKCGIALRITRNSLDKLYTLDEDLSKELSALISKRKVLVKNKPEDIINLLRSHGVRDESFLEKVSLKTLNFSIAMQEIKDHIKNHPPSQLEFDFQ